MLAYAGKWLRVNLTDRSHRQEALGEGVARTLLGGRGWGAKLLWDEVPRGADALGPGNRLMITAGPLTGTRLSGSARYMACGKSPLTGIYGEANSGGGLGIELKRAGYDALIVEGCSDGPVYLWIHDGEVEIRAAGQLWGQFTKVTEQNIKEDVGDRRAWVASIGPSGERLVKIAGIVSHGTRVAARTGLGAVMGSKGLKAIAVRGTGRVSVADEEGVKALASELNRTLRNSASIRWMREHGTDAYLSTFHSLGILPTENFRKGLFPGHERISGEIMTQSILKHRSACPGCAVACIRNVEISEGPFSPVDPYYGGPEYETAAAFGSLCGNDNLRAIAKAHEICNMYGVDTISAGNIIAWVMECCEKGILAERDLDGISLTWGNAQEMIELLEKICQREGIGDLLAEGVAHAAREIAGGSEQFALHVKGLEVAMQEPRGKKGLALTYATGARGAAHTEATADTIFAAGGDYPLLGHLEPVDPFSTGGKARLIFVASTLRAVVSGAGMCNFVAEPFSGAMGAEMTARALSLATGWEMSLEELFIIGERMVNLARAFNVREGLQRQDDALPDRFADPFDEGPTKGQTITEGDVDRMLDEYYTLRGWTKEGMPSRSKLRELGLGQVAEELGTYTARTNREGEL